MLFVVGVEPGVNNIFISVCKLAAHSLSYGQPYAQGDVVSILLDFDKSTIEFLKNGVTQGTSRNTQHNTHNYYRVYILRHWIC